MILARVLPAYLNDLQRTVTEGGMSERELINSLEQLLSAVTTRKAKKVLSRLKIDLAGLFANLGDARLPKLTSFLKKRRPRVR